MASRLSASVSTVPRWLSVTLSRMRRCLRAEAATFASAYTYRSALETIAAHERTHLQPADHQAFFAALDTPPEPTDRLRSAWARHRGTIASR